MRWLGPALAFLFLATPAHAQLYTCLVVADPVPFGSVDPLDATATDAVGNVRVSCTLIGIIALLVSYDISLTTGLSGDVNARQMGAGADRLDYNLYRNAARTQVWGDAGAGQGVSDGYLLGIGTVIRDYTVYGRVPAGQTGAPPGVYLDTLTARVDY